MSRFCIKEFQIDDELIIKKEIALKLLIQPLFILQIQPGELETDQERLILFQEKKQLLLEYRGYTFKGRSKEQIEEIQSKCKELENELNNAYEVSNQCIAIRLKMHEEKQNLLQELLDALREVSHLERKLKSVSSQSTLSISSGSSLGSLSTASSKGSLTRLSFTDIYGDPLFIEPYDTIEITKQTTSAFQLNSDLSLSPRSSLSIETPPVSPMKTDILNEPLYENRQNLELLSNELNDLREINSRQSNIIPPLSPIYERPSSLDVVVPAVISRSSSISNTRSVSAAVSDESVAGDSGVFEASRLVLKDKDTAQVQIGLKYYQNNLLITIEKARNLSALYIPSESYV